MEAPRKVTSTKIQRFRMEPTASARLVGTGAASPKPKPRAASSTATIKVRDLSIPSPEYSNNPTATVAVVAAAAPVTNEGTQCSRSFIQMIPLIYARCQDSFSA